MDNTLFSFFNDHYSLDLFSLSFKNLELQKTFPINFIPSLAFLPFYENFFRGFYCLGSRPDVSTVVVCQAFFGIEKRLVVL